MLHLAKRPDYCFHASMLQSRVSFLATLINIQHGSLRSEQYADYVHCYRVAGVQHSSGCTPLCLALGLATCQNSPGKFALAVCKPGNMRLLFVARQPNCWLNRVENSVDLPQENVTQNPWATPTDRLVRQTVKASCCQRA